MAAGFEPELSADFYDSDPEIPEDSNGIYTAPERTDVDLFQAARNAIKTKKTFTDDEAVNKFFDIYGEIAGKFLPEIAGNLLHVLVEIVKHTDGIKPDDVELLVRRLVKKHPNLLIQRNRDEHNPVFMAIRASQHQLVEYMISTCVEDSGQAIYEEPLNEALRWKAPGSGTCLHVALKERFDPATTRLLIENAGDDALAVQDDLGKTPMHYAVSFRECTDVRAELIALFIKRDVDAIRNKSRGQKTFLDILDGTGTSIYQEHQNTKASTMRQLQIQSARNNRQDQNDTLKSTDQQALKEPRSQIVTRDSRYMTSARLAGDQEVETRERFANDDSKLDDREKLRQKRKAEEAAKLDLNRLRSTNATRPQEPAAPNTPIKRSNTARFDSKPDQQKEKTPTRPAPSTRKSTRSGPKLSVCNKNSNKILLSLKLHYLRTRNTEMAISFLYGTNMDDIQISFDYDRLPRKMPWNKFVKQFGENNDSHLKFDSVLQYVTLPQVQVQLTGRLADLEREAESRSETAQYGPLGRKDMEYFFNWLYKKGVRHIIKLSVEDTGDSGEKVHSDQAIQNCLERFTIENLNWQKTDLDPETILCVGSKVEKETPESENKNGTELVPDRELKQLYLRWSGSNAVLRAWSELEGLPMLSRLQTIHLFKPPSDKTYNSSRWIDQKIEEFKTRLNESRKTIQARGLATPGNQSVSNADIAFDPISVIVIEWNANKNKATSYETAQPTADTSDKVVNSHRWLNSAARFAEEMNPFWKDTVADFLEWRQNQGTPEKIEEDVVIALIDDGVDMFDPALSNRVLEGKSFDFHDGKVRPPFSSATGHGTVMASMILQICPMAKVYPIRLKTYGNQSGKNNIDADYAALAIQAALDKKATIISMSWTLPMKKDKNDSKNRLHAVLEKAVKQKVLMFCSAPDAGKFTELDYPSGPWRDRFFRIGAARADGALFQWTPEDVTYVLPGVDVSAEQAGSSAFEKMSAGWARTIKYETGSSVATALAAGLAAMVIYCVKASVLAVKTANRAKEDVVGVGIPEDGAVRVADPDAMRGAFANLGTVTANSFVQVWEGLDPVSEMLARFRTQRPSPNAEIERIEAFTKFGQKLYSSVK
ncbi:hypothetical protein F4781DRAFT_428267 [Annulohypoxylon bovei var. microspora]|nr:hypothetical protein F4781DRAFT_428267 [Annulohypoxylon bovei var. microspora]